MATRLTNAQIAQARRADLVQLVGRRVKLVLKNGIAWGCCPFHPDRDPSFKVDNNRGSYHCFGCGAHGGPIDWLLKVEGLKFKDAVAALTSDSCAAAYNIHRGSQTPSGFQKVEPSTVPDDRTVAALRFWRDAVPLRETLGEHYYIHHRDLDVRRIDLTHVIRWHSGERAIIALMTHAITNRPTGVHRTFLDRDGRKIKRKMLGPAGIVRLSPDSNVTAGLGISEGVENGLAVMLSGFRPVWACATAGGIKKFPVLAGIGVLTIFADLGPPIGMQVAEECATRWRNAGREAFIVPPIAPRSATIL